MSRDNGNSRKGTRIVSRRRNSRAPKNFIKGAIKRPGALTKRVGGPPGKNLAKVRQIARTGSTLAKRQANFFLKVLRPASKSRGSK